MFNTIRNAWRIPDLRKKILYTLLIIIVFRFGSVIPAPFLDASALSELMASAGENSALGYINMLTGGAFSYASLFAMGITPYINSSIIMQLLTIAIPLLERMAKEGEEGRKKIATITRYVTVILGLIQGVAYYFYLRSQGIVEYTDGFAGVFVAFVIVLTFTAGTALIMWMGEQINDKGVGNGISIILFAGIVSRFPRMISDCVSGVTIWSAVKNGTMTEETLTAAGYTEAQAQAYLNGALAPWSIALLVIGMLALIAFIVFINDAERRIPVQYAKRQVGRKMYGGQSSTLPMKVNMSGVLPIIFAQSIAMIPSTIAAFCKQPKEGTFWYGFLNAIDTKSVLYMIFYFLMIIAFSYFYATIQFNPVEISNNLKKNGGFIPGFRPGNPTAAFIQKVLNKVTLFGAVYLGIVAILPLIIGKIVNVAALSIGGTSVIIVVGVALETVQALESQMLMRQYKGFLE